MAAKNAWRNGTLGAVLTTLLALMVGGCGSKSTSVVSPPPENPGTGSGTLLVNAAVNGAEGAPSTYTTDFVVTVRDTLNLPVNNATVSVLLPSGTTQNVPRDTLTGGRYAMTMNGYLAGRYGLTVVRGTENIQGAVETGPELHTITAPTPSDTLATNQPFNVIWSRIVRTDTAEVETRDYGPVQTADDGSHTVTPPQNVRTDQRIRVKRINEVLLAGGLAGSVFSASLRRQVEPLIVR
jgi:hypothetical protein